MKNRIGSLFSGYGGLDLAVQQVYDAEVAWHVEFDDAPSRILAHHWPDVPNLHDVTQVDWSTVEPVDILTGGFPCQDVSVAGRRAGMTDGTRSGLWSHMAHAIDVLRPPLVIIENVGGLFSAEATRVVESHPLCLGDGGSGVDTVLLRAVDAVLSTLSELGYDAEWTALRAADVGAPHGRLRVFITAHPQGDAGWLAHGDGGDVADSDGGVLRQHRGGAPAEEARAHEDHRPSRASGGAGTLALLPTPRALDATGVRGVTGNRTPEANARAGLTLTDVTRLLPTPGANLGENGGPQHPDKRRAGGHSVSIEDAVHGLSLLPTPRATDGTKGGPNQRGSSGDLMLPSAVAQLLPTPSAADVQGGRKHRSGARSDELLLNGIAAADAFGPYAPAIQRWEQALGRPAPAPTEPGKTRPRLASRFVEWLMGLDDGHVTGVGLTRNQELKALGNGVVPQQGAAALRHLDKIRRTS